MLRTTQSDKNVQGDYYVYVGVNMPAYVYVCRLSTDNDNGVPDFLSAWNKANATVTQITLTNDDVLQCYYQTSEVTHRIGQCT
jgi:hypothetical protein